MSKNTVIALLALLVFLLAVIVAVDRVPGLAASFRPAPEGEPVSLVDVVLDREGRRFVDLLFDRPLGAGKIGEILGTDPATLDPPTGGAWIWQGGNVLRFEPSNGFAVATRYVLTVLPEALLSEGQRLEGPARREFQTDAFLVEGIDVTEETAQERAAVALRFDLRFNYRVDPRVLLSRLKLIDPSRGATEPVRLFVETGWPSRVIGVRSEPVRKSVNARTLTLSIARTLTPVDGNVPLTEEFAREVPLGSSERLEAREVRAEPGTEESAIRIGLSSPVSVEAARPYVSIAPEVAWRLSASGNDLVLTGDFRHGETYAVALAQGLPGDDGSALREVRTFQVAIPDLAPSLDFQSPGMFLSARGWRSVALESVNVDRVRIVVDRVYRNNLFVLFQYHGWEVQERRGWSYSDAGWSEDGATGRETAVPGALGDRIAKRVVRVSSERNRKAVTVVALDDLVRGEPGLYRIEASRPDTPETAVRWLLITDLGLVAKQGSGDLLLWASSFSDLAPVSGAEVRVLSDKNQTIARGSTDGSGIFRQGGLAAVFAKQKPYLVTVERGGDFAFLLLPETAMDTSGLDVGGSRPGRPSYEAYAYGERDLYRPGEIARGAVVLRDSDLRPPAPMPVVVRHLDPLGRELATYASTTGREGIAALEIPIQPVARTGPHVAEILVAREVVGRWRFQVEDFVPDRIRVDLRAAEKTVAPGVALEYEVKGDYLFGAPASGLDVESRVRLRSVAFAPEGWEGWTFSNDDREFSDREIDVSRGVLDKDGRAAFAVEIPPALTPPSALEAEIVARAQESGGRGVAARARVRVHPYPYYVGLKRADAGDLEPGRTVTLEWTAVDGSGKPARAGALRFEAFRDRWNTVLRRTPQGTWRYETTRESVPLETSALPGGASRGTVAFTPREFGSYRAVVTDVATGASARIALEAWGWGYASWAMKDPDRLEMSLDGEEYRPGETAKVRVRSPFPGKLLLSVERDGVLRTSVHSLPDNTAEIPLPVEDTWRPNVHVTGIVVRAARDVEPGTAGRAFGAVPLLVDRAPNRMELALSVPGSARPRGPLEVSVRAEPGSIVTVAAVDEGILQLVAQKTPDPFEFFYRRIGLGVRSHDTFALLLPEGVRRDRRASTGGDAALLDPSRIVRTEGIRRVEPVSLWSGPLEVDARGEAVARFELPEFQGALRVMAVAAKGRRFSSSHAFSRVRDPIVLLPTVPRVLAPGDALTLPVLVRNEIGADAEVRIRVDAEGPVRVSGDGARSVRLKQGEGATVSFDLRAEETAGPVTLVFEASAGTATARSTERLGVRHDLAERVFALGGRVDSAAFDIPGTDTASLRPETVRRDVRLGPHPVIPLAGKLRELLRYPYGCLEQVVSAAFPLVYLGDLARSLDPSAFEVSAPQGRVQDAVFRLASMQLTQGGFAMWPDGETPAPWPSLWATHFLVEAKRSGFLVETGLLDRSLRYAAQQTLLSEPTTEDAVTRAAYAHLALARAGRPDRAGMDLVRSRHDGRLSTGGRALLAASYASSGDARAALELLRGIEVVAEAPGRTTSPFESAVRDRAAMLLALLDSAPDDPRVTRLVERLGRDAAATAWTTHESGWALLALGQLVRRQTSLGPYSGTVSIDGREIGAFDASPKAFRDLPGSGRLALRMASPYAPGAAYWALLTRGIPRDAAHAAASSGIEIERAFLDRYGAPLDPSSLRQGDLVVVRTRVRSTSGRIDDVAVLQLLPAGLEVENPRLTASETLPWITGDASPAYLEARDDRIVHFIDLREGSWATVFSLLRAVHAGSFRLPPPYVEAMYDPARFASGERGTLVVRAR